MRVLVSVIAEGAAIAGALFLMYTNPRNGKEYLRALLILAYLLAYVFLIRGD